MRAVALNMKPIRCRAQRLEDGYVALKSRKRPLLFERLREA